MPAYYSASCKEVLKLLKTDSGGLSQAEAEDRLNLFGPNSLKPPPPISAWKILFNQFSNFIIYLLLFAVLFSIIIGEYGDSLVILAILVLNGIIGFFQEYNANRSLEALKRMATIQAAVLRDGKLKHVTAEQLVCGDILHLEHGDKIPADARLLNVVELQLDESPLTGESMPVRKQTAPISGQPGPADQTNMVFSSTSVVEGRGLAVVTACGQETEIGKISTMISEAKEEKTPLQRRLDRFGRNIGMVIIGICLLVFLLLMSRLRIDGEPLTNPIFLQFAFISISLAVAAVPTALPAVVTIALSIGTRRLLKKNMLVRRLTSVETLGSCDVICSDKTGTLTRNQMTVREGWCLGTSVDFDQDDGIHAIKKSEQLNLLFTAGVACNNSLANLRSDSGGNPTELALLRAADKAGITFEGMRLAERPFNSRRKCMSVAVESENRSLLYSKGAPEQMLNRCTHAVIQDSSPAMKRIPLSETERNDISDTYHRFGAQAMRVIAFAYREISDNEDFDELAEEGLTFIGLQAMIDPPREGVVSAIEKAKLAHIRVIMITGDHRETANAIAKQTGIEGECVTGAEIDAMNDIDLAVTLDTTNIFARVVPEHKQRIVSGLQDKGHIVAMTGDGVNDAPALKKADIGIAIGSGTDVAHEAADFVLLDDSFISIVAGIEEGRGIYENIQKSIMLLLSGNLMEVLVIFLAVLLGFNLPLTALLLLWINLITDGAPALAYSVDPYGTAIMQRPPIPPGEGILPRTKLRLLVSLGSIGALISLVLFQLTGGGGNEVADIQRGQTVVFSYIVLFEMILVFILRRSYQVPLLSNHWLWIAVVFSLATQIFILYTPARFVFHVTALEIQEICYLLLATFVFMIPALIITRAKPN
ncbi:cation-translocating P-type ATPase [Desulfosediminicola sp.]|uniref:cation-translocating P-type ATPase n=1 Tax=Desulfosediminicola sp. TaxID=2886825 RepID=UPI003AF25369